VPFSCAAGSALLTQGRWALLDEVLASPTGKYDDLVHAAAYGSAFLFDKREPRLF